MQEVGRSLRQGYAVALSGIVHDGIEVRIYNGLATASAPKYHIVVSSQNEVEVSRKSKFLYEAHITLDIVTLVDLEDTDSSHCEAIASEVLGRIRNKNQQITIPSFRVIKTKVTLSKSLSGQTKTGRFYRKIITFKHLIEE